MRFSLKITAYSVYLLKDKGVTAEIIMYGIKTDHL